MQDFGIAVNGVPFDPGAAEFYLGDRQSGWQYEALSGAVPLGIDENYAHVQPTGGVSLSRATHGIAENFGTEKTETLPAGRLGGGRVSDLCSLRLRRCKRRGKRGEGTQIELSVETGTPPQRSR